ncbi:MAG TPA: ribonuclease P protein component [Verrucomicrobiae bacterium]|jgi:ribonuclease P protein component
MAGQPSLRLLFPRSSRLKSRGEFARARAEGKRLVCGCVIANVLPRVPGQKSRLGVVTSKKIGGAVVRSRARRLLRESFRLHQRDLARAVDLVLVARPSIAGKKLADVEADLRRVLRQARLDGACE